MANGFYLWLKIVGSSLSILYKTSAEEILKYFSYHFLENRLWHSMQIVTSRDNLQKLSKSILWEK